MNTISNTMVRQICSGNIFQGTHDTMARLTAGVVEPFS